MSSLTSSGGKSSGQSVRLGIKRSGFDPRAVPKSECMFINFTTIKLCLMLYYVFDCCFGLYNC